MWTFSKPQKIIPVLSDFWPGKTPRIPGVRQGSQGHLTCRPKKSFNSFRLHCRFHSESHFMNYGIPLWYIYIYIYGVVQCIYNALVYRQPNCKGAPPTTTPAVRKPPPSAAHWKLEAQPRDLPTTKNWWKKIWKIWCFPVHLIIHKRYTECSMIQW